MKSAEIRLYFKSGRKEEGAIREDDVAAFRAFLTSGAEFWLTLGDEEHLVFRDGLESVAIGTAREARKAAPVLGKAREAHEDIRPVNAGAQRAVSSAPPSPLTSTGALEEDIRSVNATGRHGRASGLDFSLSSDHPAVIS